MATGARSETEVLSCVDPVSPIRVIGRRLQHVRFAFERYETPAEREEQSAWNDVQNSNTGTAQKHIRCAADKENIILILI